MLNGLLVVKDSGLQLARITVDGVLHDKWVVTLLQFGQVFEKWADVFCPEDKAVYIFPLQANTIDLSPIGVDRVAISFMEAVHKPLTVEGGNVCFVAG